MRAPAPGLALLGLAVALVAVTVGPAASLAQKKVRTETFRKPAAADATPAAAPGGTTTDAPQPATTPVIITDFSRLPKPVAAMRERILAAARSGDLDRVAALMREGPTATVFSFGDQKDPVAFWRASYPDSGGLEALSILVTILETGAIHVEAGTPQEAYIWPYFTRMPLKALTPPQKVELFRIITGYDYKQMVDFGAYMFYRAGITPDGHWRFFVAGD